ncbi:DUF4387 domain-containing protein [Clostridiaceae bacterium OttesenSCG-928-D20]|nr:DUF4387 domain-containing protein [Clostridiaceae bacterium OttesenSCG-928-D20]
MKVKLSELCDVIRSKNAGPFELTFDIIFKEFEVFKKICDSGQINKASISDLLNIPEEEIIAIVNFEPSKAIKITVKRRICSGDLGETDVYGAQQHAPFLSMTVEV